MADLERIKPMDEAQLKSALMQTDELSRRRLPDEEYAQLVVLFDQMQVRYPAQDLAEATEGYLMDLEQLALRYSVPKVQKALAELRITPGQKFFPRPDEVAATIEDQRERKMTPTAQDAQHYLAELKRWREEHESYMREKQATA